jgi:hypothetical protein
MLQTLIYCAALSIPLIVADHLTGTTMWSHQQEGNIMFQPDHFDIFSTDDDGELEALLSNPTIRDAADEVTAFVILTDSELDAIDNDVDEVPEEDWLDYLSESYVDPYEGADYIFADDWEM